MKSLIGLIAPTDHLARLWTPALKLIDYVGEKDRIGRHVCQGAAERDTLDLVAGHIRHVLVTGTQDLYTIPFAGTRYLVLVQPHPLGALSTLCKMTPSIHEANCWARSFIPLA